MILRLLVMRSPAAALCGMTTILTLNKKRYPFMEKVILILAENNLYSRGK